jgi:hypothetical protein
MVRVCTAALLLACRAPSEPKSNAVAQSPPPLPATPPAVVLLVTPKMIADFASPDSSVSQFFAHYNSLTSKASETIVIFAVGNGDHILTYRGSTVLGDTATWARFTDGIAVSNRILTYLQIKSIVDSFKRRAAILGLHVKVYDQMDSGNEFSENTFRYGRHAECMDSTWASYDIRASLKHDTYFYATAPDGIVAGTSCGKFLADQVSAYLRDLGFDGILYGNQLGTRGRWLPDNGPGYTDAEALAIHDFMQYSKAVLGADDLMWFDSYNDVSVEHSTFSFPGDGYQYFTYLIAAGFCVITTHDRYVDDLQSKLQIKGGLHVIATLDYVDPWYTYESLTAYPVASAQLEQTAIDNRNQISGIVFFANDHLGGFVPQALIDSFASRFFAP